MDHLGICFNGVGPEVTHLLHICRGTPGFVSSYDGSGKAPSHQCYGELLPDADSIAVDVISVEQAFCPTPVSVFKHITKKSLMLGVVDVASSEVETVEAIVGRARSVMEVVDPARIILAPDCGFSFWNKLPDREYFDTAQAKLRNLVRAASLLNASL